MALPIVPAAGQELQVNNFFYRLPDALTLSVLRFLGDDACITTRIVCKEWGAHPVLRRELIRFAPAIIERRDKRHFLRTVRVELAKHVFKYTIAGGMTAAATTSILAPQLLAALTTEKLATLPLVAGLVEKLLGRSAGETMVAFRIATQAPVITVAAITVLSKAIQRTMGCDPKLLIDYTMMPTALAIIAKAWLSNSGHRALIGPGIIRQATIIGALATGILSMPKWLVAASDCLRSGIPQTPMGRRSFLRYMRAVLAVRDQIPIAVVIYHILPLMRFTRDLLARNPIVYTQRIR